MTEEQTALMNKLFTRYYGHLDEISDARVNIHVFRPDTLDDLDRISRADATAQGYIDDLNERIRQLNAYRQCLYERYNEVATAPTVPVVKLIRRRYGGYGKDAHKILYDLKIYTRNLNDNKEVETHCTTYPGTERNKAIAAYKAYVKAHPGIAAEMDIEKGRWER